MASTRSVEDLGLGLPVSESRPPGAGAVTKKGWFQKRGQPPFTDFKTRFFVLQGTDVRYYASEDDYEEQAAPKGSFSCVGLQIGTGSVTAHSAQHGFHFVLYVHDTAASNQKKEIECACSTELERAEWLAALEEASHLGKVATSLQTASEDQLVPAPNEASSGFHFPHGALHMPHLPLPHLSFRHSHTGQRGMPQPNEATDNPIPHAGAVTKKGWFQKRGQPPFTDFKTRFFVLQGTDVRYYASEDDYEEQAAPKGSFSCVGLQIGTGSVTAHSAQHGFHFVLYVHDTAASNQKKEIECACSTELERAEWLAALEEASHLGKVATSLQTASEDQLVPAPNEASSGFHFPHGALHMPHLPLPHLSFRHSHTGQRGMPHPSEATDNPIPHLHLDLDAAQVSGII